MPLCKMLGKPRSATQAEQRETTAPPVTRLHELRAIHGLSIETLAGRSGVSTGMTNDTRKYLPNPWLTTLLRWRRGLEMAAGELLDGLPLPQAPRESPGPRRRRQRRKPS